MLPNHLVKVHVQTHACGETGLERGNAFGKTKLMEEEQKYKKVVHRFILEQK